ncbi:stearoyl-CoA desaturase 5-like [Ostrinia nubilalis]|uniref:stearoyl-CoA desaturase 5-like n=1 Tax=Ostrinia nubilalis TaxID=29057 RepID=UPI00308251A4
MKNGTMNKPSEVEVKPSLEREFTSKEIDQETQTKISVYDQLRPKNEGPFMSAVRELEKKAGFETPIVYFNILVLVMFHALILVSAYLIFIDRRYYPKRQTFIFLFSLTLLTTFGVTAGAHRLWSHRAYKAKIPLQIMLLIGFLTAGMNDLYNWVRDHRVHHKFSETSADPHNATRGFFFSHVGWMMTKQHPDVLREAVKVDMSDIEGNPLIRFHVRHFKILKLLFALVLPVLIPVVFWDERISVAFLALVLKHAYILHTMWSVNSFAHLYGNRPYNSKINPRENWVLSVFSIGEGWHNYHHTFPWDYKAAELAFPFNGTTNLLDLFAKIGWAYDRKVASPALIKNVAESKGDSTYNEL